MKPEEHPGVRVHPSALIEAHVQIGEGSAIWDNVHIRHGARIGRSCIVGEKSYVAYDVSIGDHCKLNTAVYVCAGVTIESDCMISAHVVFTNDRYPRAFDIRPGALASSDPTQDTLTTHVGRGVTIGANATIGPGLRLGEYSMIGMGSVVTRDVPPHALVVGNPASVEGWVCTCGPRIATAETWRMAGAGERFECGRCGRAFERIDGRCVECRPPQGGREAVPRD